MNPIEFQSLLLRDGFADIDDRELPPDYSAELHAHEYDVRGLVTAGVFTLEVDGESRACREGEVFAVDAGRRHREITGAAGACYVVGRRRPAGPT